MPLQDDTAVAPERVQDLWFPDANLILRAENKLFRVYKHILGARSPVFRDMASFPQPATPEGGTIDGIPVVHLHDSDAEAEAFLRAIFDSSFFMPPPAATDFSIVIGVMRLSHKYDVPYLFRRAISHLESMYPHTLPEMQDLCAGTTGCHVTFPFRVDTDLITLRAVSEVGALWILPTAYYGVCAHSPKEFLEAGAPWSALTTHEQQTCLKSQIEFVRATASAHEFLRDLPVQSCSADCDQVVSNAQRVLSFWRTTSRDLEPLCPSVLLSIDNELCSYCEAYADNAYEHAQAGFWNRLPDILGLPGWEELVEMQRAVMEDTT